MRSLTSLQHLSRLSLSNSHLTSGCIIMELLHWGLTGLQELALTQYDLQDLAALLQMPRLRRLSLRGVLVMLHSAADWPALQASQPRVCTVLAIGALPLRCALALSFIRSIAAAAPCTSFSKCQHGACCAVTAGPRPALLHIF